MSAQRAIRHYSARTHYWQARRHSVDRADRIPWPTCFHARRAAREWQARARTARETYERWHDHHYDWRSWLPEKHQRVARCETGYQGGTGPGGSRWDWDSGTYVSAFGIYLPAYNADAARAGNLGWHETISKLGRHPTPREQYEAVEAHRAQYGGWSGWGCRGA